MADPIVTTAQGQLRGAEKDGVLIFKGVRYGASTAGANRFRPPQPAPAWAGVQDALEYGPSCPQPGPARSPEKRKAWFDWASIFGMEDDTAFGLDEDCLRLNVWTRGLGDGKRRPVMLRIHGGGYAMGSGSWGWHDGANLAKRGDVVVVTVNHRLGILGYSQLPESFGPDFAASGNVGLLDLVAALEWVRENIAAFGGDPENVTIFGESGGGMKIGVLTAMPWADGLFHRAIIQSAPVGPLQSRAAATATGVAMLAQAGIADGDLAALQALPVDALLLAQHKTSPGGASPYSPFEDGVVIPGQPAALAAQGRTAKVPLMIGTDRHETALFLSRQREDLVGMSEADLERKVGRLPGAEGRAADLIAAYKRLWPQASSCDLFVLMQSDQQFRLPSIGFAEKRLAGRAGPVFMYLMAWESGALDGFVKAAHGMEVPLTMDNVWSAPAARDYPGAQAVAEQMSEAWIAFARTGDPNHPGIPAWPAYDTDRRATMVFDVKSAVADDPQGERALWTAKEPGTAKEPAL